MIRWVGKCFAGEQPEHEREDVILSFGGERWIEVDVIEGDEPNHELEREPWAL